MRAILRHVLSGSLVIALVFAASMASANEGGDELSEEEFEEEVQEGSSSIARAQEAFEEGARKYYEEDYSGAIVEFRRANQIYEHGIFQHNIALANRALGRNSQGLSAALEAQENIGDLDEETAAANQALIASFQTAQSAEAAAEDIGARVAELGGVSDSPSGWGGLGWTGVAMLGVGASALGGAAILDHRINSGIEELQGDDMIAESEFRSRRDSLATQQTVGQVFLFSGIGLAFGGATLTIVELVTGPSSTDSSVALAPSMTRPGLDMVVRW